MQLKFIEYFYKAEALCFLWRRDQAISLKSAIVSWIRELAGTDRSVFLEKLCQSPKHAKI